MEARSIKPILVGLLLAALVAPTSLSHAADDAPPAKGTLRIFITDGESGAPSPARLEVLDASGDSHVPSDALPAPGECSRAKAVPWWNELSSDEQFPRSIVLPYTPTSSMHFYALENGVELQLKPGKYEVVAQKGPEYRIASTTVEIGAGKTEELALTVERWTDMAKRGWFSADDHLHITRTSAHANEFLVRWFEAEDLNVACLLEMGSYKGLVSAPQYAFGKDGTFLKGRRLLVSGQENPRTWLLGHGIILGAGNYIDFPKRYLIYSEYWREAERQNAINGYAHWGVGPGFALDLPEGNLEFVELLQRDATILEPYYRGLNLGARLSATAGADYPCIPWGAPGRNRFYTRVDGALSEASWLEGIRRGRTFVTNGPMLEFRAGNSQIGDTIEFDTPLPVALSFVVEFDPDRDAVDAAEILHDGQVVATQSKLAGPGRLVLEATVSITSSGWLAARTEGRKLRDDPEFGKPLRSIAHTAPIYLRHRPQEKPDTPAARSAAAASLELLEKLEAALIAGYQKPKKVSPILLGFDGRQVLWNAGTLFEEIEESVAFYETIAGPSESVDPSPSDAPAAEPSPAP